MQGINNRLQKLENAAKRHAAEDTQDCRCPDGKRRFYFIFDNLTEAEAAERYPDNRKHCHRCGGLNCVVRLFDDSVFKNG